MKFSLFAFVTFAVGAAALAVPVPSRPVVNPTEQMVITPGLTHLGKSRISTIHFCEKVTKVANYKNILTDSDFENFERCLIEQT
jgi:hypothetical protein